MVSMRVSALICAVSSVCVRTIASANGRRRLERHGEIKAHASTEERGHEQAAPQGVGAPARDKKCRQRTHGASGERGRAAPVVSPQRFGRVHGLAQRRFLVLDGRRELLPRRFPMTTLEPKFT
jgi:hypothetical protein